VLAITPVKEKKQLNMWFTLALPVFLLIAISLSRLGGSFRQLSKENWPNGVIANNHIIDFLCQLKPILLIMFQKILNHKNYFKPSYTLLGLALIFLFFSSCNQKEETLKGNFDGWQILGDAEWRFDQMELIGTVKDSIGFVVTENRYSDFILELEFKPDRTINSGIYIRCQNQKLSVTECYEINIWDLHPNQDFRTGAIVNRAIPLNYVETIGEWNTYKIQIQGDHLQTWINDIPTADLKDNSLAEGYIALQAMGTGEIRFRNVKFQSLSGDN
jgi:hypothetical protein